MASSRISHENELQIVESYWRPHEAHLARSALQSIGIHAVIADEHIVGAYPLLVNAIRGVKLLVAARDLARAHELLTQARGPSPEEVRYAADRKPCMRCGSRETSLGPRRVKIALIPWLRDGKPLFQRRRNLRCHDCGERF
jgi:hypothetical protein